MEPGLRTEQVPAAKAFIDGEIDRALTFLESKGKVTYASTGQEDEANRLARENRFFTAVEDIVKRTEGDPAKRAQSVLELKEAKLKAAQTGIPNKGFGEILMSGLSGLNPVALIGEGIASAVAGGSFFASLAGALKSTLMASVKDAAISFGGDAAAPWLKSVKARFAEGREITSEQAGFELSAQNGAAALGASLGIDQASMPAFVAGAVTAIEQRRAGQPVATTAAPAEPSRDPAALQAALEADRNRATGAAPAGVPSMPSGTTVAPPPSIPGAPGSGLAP